MKTDTEKQADSLVAKTGRILRLEKNFSRVTAPGFIPFTGCRFIRAEAYSEVIQLFCRAIELFPEEGSFWFGRANMHLAAFSLEAAQREFNEVDTKFPVYHSHIKLVMVQIAIERKDKVRAKVLLQELNSHNAALGKPKWKLSDLKLI